MSLKGWRNSSGSEAGLRTNSPDLNGAARDANPRGVDIDPQKCAKDSIFGPLPRRIRGLSFANSELFR